MNEKLVRLNRVDVKTEIAELKKFLADTDYVSIKIAEGVATKEDYAEVLAERESARERIRELEN